MAKETFKGLVKPQFTSNDPLDILFEELVKILEKRDIKSLNKQLGLESIICDSTIDSNSPIDLASIKVNGSKIVFPKDELFTQRYQVVSHLLDKLIQLKELAIEAKIKQDKEHQETLTISLHDMKTFSKLISTIVFEGVYSSLPNNIGISLEKRRINEYKKGTKIAKISIVRLDSNTQRFLMLSLIINKMLKVFTPAENNDVRELLIKGMGYSDLLVCSLYLLHHPEIEKAASWGSIFQQIEDLSQTFELFEIYTLLISSKTVPWFKNLCLNKITYLPLRRKTSGVASLVEFISGIRYDQEVTVEKYDQLNKILLNKPAQVTTVTYFDNVFSQIYNILMLTNRPVLTSMCVNFTEVLYKRNPRIVIDFLYKRIWSKCNPPADSTDGKVLVSGQELQGMINVGFSILKNSTYKPLIESLVGNLNFGLCLWNYMMFLDDRKLNGSQVTVREMFKLMFMTLPKDKSLVILKTFMRNLLVGLSNNPWVFKTRSTEVNGVITQSTAIVSRSLQRKELEASQMSKEKIFEIMDRQNSKFIEVLKSVNEELVQEIFCDILQVWLLDNKRNKSLLNDENDNDSGTFIMLTNLKLLQTMSLEFKDAITGTKNVSMVLTIVNTMIDNYKQESRSLAKSPNVTEEQDSDDEIDEGMSELKLGSDTMLSSVIDILIFILSEQNAYKVVDVKNIETLEKIVGKIGSMNVSSDTKKSLQDALAQLRSINAKLVSKSNESSGSQKELMMKLEQKQQMFEEDIEKYDAAMENLSSKIVPIRVHGLQMIEGLIAKKSKIIKISEAVQMYIRELAQPDPFMFLSAVKGLSKLTEMNLEQVFPILVYSFSTQKLVKKDLELGTVLKIGQVIDSTLLKFDADPVYAMQSDRHSSMVFPASQTALLCHELVNIVRVKPDRVVVGDIRLSALSILETGFHAEINGIGEYVQDALDLAIGVLQFEKTDKQTPMRRGSARLIYQLLCSKWKFPKGYGPKIRNTLKIVQNEDIDVLTREQAGEILAKVQEEVVEMLKGSE